MSPSDEITCPDCAEHIKALAKVCKHCGYRFPTQAATAPSPKPNKPADLKPIYRCPYCSKPTSQVVSHCIHCNKTLPESGGGEVKGAQSSSEAGWSDRTFEGDPKGLFSCLGVIALITIGALIYGISSCSSSASPEKAEEQVVLPSPEELAANRALAEIAYPKCEQPFNDKSVTKCGEEVFIVAMRECRGRSLAWAKSGTIIDEYAGDSWQMAAGLAAQPDERRIEFVSPTDSFPRYEPVAVALGNGTSEIMTFTCTIDQKLRIREISSQGTMSKNEGIQRIIR